MGLLCLLCVRFFSDRGLDHKVMTVTKAVLTAAGLGTRFHPATKAQPKEMLTLVDKPLIQYVVEESVSAGIEDLIIVTGRGKTAIEDHFDVSFELEQFLEKTKKYSELEVVKSIATLTNVSYVRQKEALGLGHAVSMAETLLGEQAFAVLLGDEILSSEVPCIRQMIEIYERVQAPVVAVMKVPLDEISNYGVVGVESNDGNLHRINSFVEKPDSDQAPSNLAIIGRYILTPDIFGHLKRTSVDGRGEIQLTSALDSLLSETPVFGFEFEGARHDCGSKLGFLQASVEFALQRPDLRERFREFLKNLTLD